MNDGERNAGLLHTLRAVLWSFIGVRKSSDYKQDAVRLNPVAVVVAGILGGVIFVLVLLSVVHLIVAQQ